MRFILALMICLLSSCGGSSPIDVHAQTVPSPYGDRISTELNQGNHAPVGVHIPGQTPDQCNWTSIASSNISVFFTQNHKQIQQAWWFATLVPNNGGVRLVAYDGDDYVLTELARTPYTGETNPRPLGAFISNQLNTEIARGKVYRYLGVQVCGDAVLHSSVIYLQY